MITMSTDVSYTKAKSADIPMSALVIDDKFNCRLHLGVPDDAKPAELKAGDKVPDVMGNLLTSMKMNGQATPILVERRKEGKGEKYYLISGFRRVSAASKLGWDTIAARVFEPMTEAQRLLLNLTENTARDNLESWDVAMACHRLSVEGLDSKEVAIKIGRSDSYVRALCLDIKNIHPSIKDRWQKECVPGFIGATVCSTDWLSKINSMRDDEQLKEFEIRKGSKLKKGDPDWRPSAAQAGAGKDGAEGDKPEVKVKTQSRPNIETARTALVAKLNVETDPAVKRDLQVACDALRWVLGFTKIIERNGTDAALYNPETDKVEVTT